MSLEININKIISIAVVLVLVGCGVFFLFNLFSSFVKPFFLDSKEKSSNISLDKSLDEAAQFLEGREALPVGRQDLTGSTPSATLTLGEEKPKAEVINGSGVSGTARELADQLEALGILVPQVSNSAVESIDTVIALKVKVSKFRGEIIEKIGTKSGEIRVEVLDEDYPFDIRILIGK